MIREAVVAGKFYPDSPAKLKEMLATMLDEKVARQDVIGLVSPHAGYIYSGAVSGAVISRIKLKDTFIIMGPNHTGIGKPFSIMTDGVWRTPLGEVAIDSELATRIMASSKYLEENDEAHRFEHSIEVQLPFLQYFGRRFKLVPIMLSYADVAIYREIGQAIAAVVKNLGREAVIMASSDMTHYEPHKSACEKDSRAIEAILELDEEKLMKRVNELNISMCGYAPVASLIAAARKLGADKTELVKYLTSGDASGDYSSVVGYAGIIIKSRKMSPLAKLAKKTVERYVETGKVATPPSRLPAVMKEKAGAFVSLYKLGQLRGCIGTFEPANENVAAEIIANAISAAMHDPRFLPVTADELKDIEYSVDVLTQPEFIEDKKQLNPKKYGLIVESGYRKGLLLPDLEGVGSVEQQISICRQKAGIMHKEPVRMYRFRVERFK
ncbi:AmmeMemoRadiSam system protein B [Chloroflexota bacterium]